MKTHRYLIIAAVCFFLVGYVSHAAGPATNVVTLVWDAPINSPVPYVYEIQQSPSLVLPNWTVLVANLPQAATNFTMSISKDLMFYRIRAMNATNNSWSSDFSNVASTLWPSSGGNLGIRLGP